MVTLDLPTPPCEKPVVEGRILRSIFGKGFSKPGSKDSHANMSGDPGLIGDGAEDK